VEARSFCGRIEGGTTTDAARTIEPRRTARIASRVRAVRRAAEQVTFTDLAWDHFHWERERRLGTSERPDAAARYRATRAAFEARFGEILGEYWSTREPSGVAVTRKPPHWLVRPFVDDRLRFHRATDWVTRDAPVIADQLFRCETLAIKVTEVLRHAPETIALRRILSVASALLGHVDRTGDENGKPSTQAVVREQCAELEEIADYYQRAGSRIGRIAYTWGMVLGLVFLSALLAAFAVPLWLAGPLDWSDSGVQIFLVSYGAAAVGAFISVLQRMAGDKKFTVHYDLGKRSLYVLGSYRPVLGAVFGLFTYFLLASHLLQTEDPDGERALFFYGAVAFVAGFSERFTKVLVKGVEEKLAPASAPPEAELPGEAPPAR
jgi:hypothetical protein